MIWGAEHGSQARQNALQELYKLPPQTRQRGTHGSLVRFRAVAQAWFCESEASRLYELDRSHKPAGDRLLRSWAG